MKKLLLASLFVFCSSLVFAQNPAHEAWKKERERELLAEDGWLNLAGLIWIDEKKSYLNEWSKDSLVVADEPSSKNIGTFQWVGDSVWFFFNPKASPKPKSQKTLVYPLEYGKGGGAYFDHWKWSVIERGGNFALRLRDLTHPALSRFEPIPVFDYDSAFRVSAFFRPTFNQTMEIPNVLGQVIEWKVMGILEFELEGKSRQLTVLDELGKFFVIFSDWTNEKNTYPTGRYLYVDYPDRSGNTVIDFNFAYNPPCAFTPFATCPIPPKVNRLDVSVLAGEKLPKGH
ncbi:DUF1684 domain-containing protein [Algoriphagus taiwanensis]|uniref:DUF1684 domain-containing protein n=1 Tax=Algoriphagus taiwanensis TaxID=1445656 RepID=A0ABQ6Q5Q7_9BACT|nr:DUF1684 domain-containing protein [Algoriphagus taiwanensis]